MAKNQNLSPYTNNPLFSLSAIFPPKHKIGKLFYDETITFLIKKISFLKNFSLFSSLTNHIFQPTNLISLIVLTDNKFNNNS